MDPRNIARKLFPTSRRLLVEKSLKSLDYYSYRRVLVVGSGYDPYKNLFGSAEIYVCLDIENYDNSTDVVGDAHSLPFNNKSFDCIVASEVIEHLHHPERFIKEVERVLVGGGKMIATVPFMYHQHADPCDYWRPTSSALRRILSGFSEVEIRCQGNRIHVILDLLTTIKLRKLPVLFPFRILSHIVTFGAETSRLRKICSSAPSGFFIVAVK